MSHEIVKIIVNEDGFRVRREWCLFVSEAGSHRTFCTGEVCGDAEGRSVGRHKTVEKNGVTCHDCLKKLKLLRDLKIKT